MEKYILVVDDDPAIVDSLQIMLEDQGYRVETTMDGNDVKKNMSPYPHLILLDIWMSGVDGGEVCLFIKSQPATEHIPVILISANKNTSDIAARCGADDSLCKPFEMDVLLEKVKQHWK